MKLDNDVAVQLQMNLVHGLNLRHIFSEKKKEVWIYYSGLPIFFGIYEFTIMTGLRCHSYPHLSQQLAKIGKEGEILVNKVGKSLNSFVLIEKVCDPSLTKMQKVVISIILFVYCILCSKSADKKININWIKMASTKCV